jgi:hypothetical protein
MHSTTLAAGSHRQQTNLQLQCTAENCRCSCAGAPADADAIKAAQTLAQVADALGLQGVQFGWAAGPHAVPGASAEQQAAGKEQLEAAEQAEAAVPSNTAPGSSSVADGQSADSSPGQGGDREAPGSSDAAEPAVDAAGETHSTVLQQQQQAQAEPESSEHSEL